MMQLQRIEAVEWAGRLLFRLRFADGMVGVVDLAAELPAGTYAGDAVAADPAAVRVAERGRALVWRDRDGEEVDIDAETLRGLLGARREAAE
jgi:hypothetical protein